MKILRAVVAACFIAGAVLSAAAPVAAVPPSNDQITGATPIASVPFSVVQDTTEATTDAVDAEANAQCGAPATLASVWYSITPAGDTTFVADTAGSDYSAGLMAVTGSPGNLQVVNCGPGNIVFPASAGVTYFLMAFNDTSDVNGGELHLSVAEALPPPEVFVTIAPVAHFDPRTGRATVSGTYTCTGQADFIQLGGQLEQPVGRFLIRGGFAAEGLACTQGTEAWTATVIPDNGKFAGGRGTATAFLFACNFFGCGDAQADARVRIRR